MTRHVVAAVADIPDGGRHATTVKGRPIVVFNRQGEFFALLDRCPHSGAKLSAGLLTGLVQSDAPGCFRHSRSGEIIRCPWHGWEFDIRTGQSYCSPDDVKTKTYSITVEPGSDIVQGPFRAESIDVSVEGSYVVVDM